MMVPPTASPKELAQQSRKELYYNVFGTLMRLQIEASPINYELMYEIISGNNPDLRESFARLTKPLAPEDLEALARTHLPHHFGKSLLDNSAHRIKNELATLKESLQTGQTSLSSYSNLLEQTSEEISSIADDADLQARLQTLLEATDTQQVSSSQILKSVSTQISAVNAIAEEVEEFERMKFVHVATGLGNRRAFNKRLAELYVNEHTPVEASLVLCNLVALQPFEKKELIKAKEQILQRLGGVIQQAIRRSDFAAWLDRPQIGIVVMTTVQGAVERMAEQIRSACLSAFGTRAGGPIVVARFGCATTFDAKTAAELIAKTEKTLEAATSADGEIVVFFGNGRSGSARKEWSLYRD